MSFLDFLRARYPLLSDKDLTVIHWDIAKLAAEAEAWHAGEIMKISVTAPIQYDHSNTTKI